MRDILIVLLAILFTIMTIVLFEIKSMSQQFLTLIIVLLAFIVFYMAIDKIHIFKESKEEVNINNTSFSEEGELIEMEMENELEHEIEHEMEMENNLVSEGQNLVEAQEEVQDIENPNYALSHINTDNFSSL